LSRHAFRPPRPSRSRTCAAGRVRVRLRGGSQGSDLPGAAPPGAPGMPRAGPPGDLPRLKDPPGAGSHPGSRPASRRTACGPSAPSMDSELWPARSRLLGRPRSSWLVTRRMGGWFCALLLDLVRLFGSMQYPPRRLWVGRGERSGECGWPWGRPVAFP